MFSVNLGGGQENGLRSGTESTPLIVGFGEAVRITFSNLNEDIFHMKELRDYCIDSIGEIFPQAVIHSTKQGAPHIVNFSLPGTKNKRVLEFLDTKDIFVSSAAACKSNHSRGPSVLESLGLSRDLADSALRVSFSHMNTKKDVDALLKALDEYFRFCSSDLCSLLFRCSLRFRGFFPKGSCLVEPNQHTEVGDLTQPAS